MRDEIKIHNDNVPRVHTVITQARVEHYSDVVEYMLASAIDRYIQKRKRNPSPQSINFLRKELVRYAIIRKDVKTAQALEINESNLLLEAG